MKYHMKSAISRSVAIAAALLGNVHLIYSTDFTLKMAPIIERVQELAHHHALNPQEPKPIVAIAGCSSVGKSYFTRQLYHALRKNGVKVAIVLMDDFMNPSAVHAKKDGLHENFDHDGLHAMLQQILAGHEHVKKSAWDKNLPACFIKEETACFCDIDVILLEGIYVLCDMAPYAFSQYSMLRIFIDAAEDDIRNWKREREAAKPGPARPKEVFEKRLEWNMEDYRVNIKPSSKNAHFIILKDNSHHYTVTPAL